MDKTEQPNARCTGAIRAYRCAAILASVVTAVILIALALGVPASADGSGPLRVGVVNRFLLAPALEELEARSGSGLSGQVQVDLVELADSSALRASFAAGDVDVMVDSQQSILLIPQSVLAGSSVFWDVAASYGNIAVLARSTPGFPSGIPDLDGRRIALEAGSPGHYFAVWLNDVMSFSYGGPTRSYRWSDKAVAALRSALCDAIVAEEPMITELVQAAGEREFSASQAPSVSGTFKVLLSTANYSPQIHYLALARDSVLKQKSDQLKALIASFLSGLERLGSWERLLMSAARSGGIGLGGAYARMKYTYLDRQYNTREFFGGKGIGNQIIAAADSTWVQEGLVFRTPAQKRASQPPVRLSSILLEQVGIDGVSLRPTPRPWLTTDMTIMEITREVHFDLNKWDITAEASVELDQVIRDISATCEGGIAIQVEGYADSLGSPQLNQRLSENRAREVALHLKRALGLSDRDIAWAGRGVGGDDPSFRKTVIRVLQKVVL